MLSLGYGFPTTTPLMAQLRNTHNPFQNRPFPSLVNNPSPTKRNDSIFHHPRFSPQTKSGKLKVISDSNNYLAKTEVGGDVETQILAAGLRPELMPKHVAVIMDGNRRWAKKRGLTANEGQTFGAEKVKEITYFCIKYGIKVLTWFAFSTGNWVRPKEEVEFLMEMYEGPAMSAMGELLRYDVRGSAIGDRSALPKSLQRMINLGEDVTKKNSGLHIIGALNYSGRYDITQACKSVANKVKDGLLQPQDINESTFEQELETKCTEFPFPDLLIRTSGEHRISNFMLWQMAYTELFFADKLFPDFEEEDFIEALKSFQKRDRRYGGQKH